MEDKKLADEVYRMYTQGILVPQVWMKQAVGAPIAAEPTLKAAAEALTVVK
jgi:hypothetical protein